MPGNTRPSSLLRPLRRLSDRVLEAPDLESLAGLLTRDLPAALGVSEATLLIWNRKLDSFESLSLGETRRTRLRLGENPVPAPATRFLLSEGTVLETPGGAGEGMLMPLLARSGLVGMLVLGGRRSRRRVPFRERDARALSDLAARAALSLENHLYHAELVATERMAALGTMAGMLAHDLRSPMTVIRGYAETLLEPGVPPETVRERAEVVVQMVDRLERMTRETLDFARGGARLALRPIRLPELAEELLSRLRGEFPGLEIRAAVDLPDTVARVDVDKLGRVLGNLAANSRDAMGGQGRLNVSAHLVRDPRDDAEGEERLELVLSDEGPGVPPEIRERLFEPFVTAGKKGGTGLGLAVARRFVEDHGGTLECLPLSPGAHFRVSLPLPPPEAPGATGTESPAGPAALPPAAGSR